MFKISSLSDSVRKVKRDQMSRIKLSSMGSKTLAVLTLFRFLAVLLLPSACVLASEQTDRKVLSKEMIRLGYDQMLEIEGERYLSEVSKRAPVQDDKEEGFLERDSRKDSLTFPILFPDTASLLGPTGGVNLATGTILDRGKFLASGHYIRFRESKKLIMIHKFNYGIYDNMEVGMAVGELESQDATDQSFNLKYRFNPPDRRIVWALGYQFHNISNGPLGETIHNFYGIMDVKVNEYLKVYMNLAGASNSDTVSLNFGTQLVAINTPMHSTALYIEVEQDPGSGGYKLLNAGLKYRMSDLFSVDLMRLQNYRSSDDSSGLGFNLYF
ncbi:MAG: hypothetical protein CVV64_03330 [Candidatus Wallbacteria bacterium HGW-Wallbacteria-1]|jgi:hypothetical protein|uniref:Uncharacterized protein n=1 Tax=Candidatus Wallbacteria bacterium HGW-Wallbacteria-1 TaxID=2013854 RepID=A0A2N1PTN8_9BACT|nr:MAG: hypothetical protein CVV64_03330 [Candidatus Wallbacteria bacterium HGW-Wallbacteria-1]